MGTGGESFHPNPRIMSFRIQYASTIHRDSDAGKVRAEEILNRCIKTACPGETFDMLNNGRGWVIRMFEDGEFVQTV